MNKTIMGRMEEIQEGAEKLQKLASELFIFPKLPQDVVSAGTRPYRKSKDAFIDLQNKWDEEEANQNDNDNF